MQIGVYTAILHDRDLDSALDVIQSLGLNGAEINSGGFLPPIHLPINDIMSSNDKRDEYLNKFTSRGIKLTALNCNGNPLSPNKSVGARQAQDVIDTVQIANRLGVDRVITMSGLPAAEPNGTRAAWYVNTWSSEHLDALDYQWDEVAVPFWKKIDEIAGEFIDKLDGNFYSGASITELTFSFYVEEVGGLETERWLLEFPISDLETDPAKLYPN